MRRKSEIKIALLNVTSALCYIKKISFNYFEQCINMAFDISGFLNVMQMEIIFNAFDFVGWSYNSLFSWRCADQLFGCLKVLFLQKLCHYVIWWHCFINTFKIFVYSWPSFWWKFAYYTSASGSKPILGLLVLLWACQHVIKISLDLFCVERWLLIGFFFSKCWVAKKTHKQLLIPLCAMCSGYIHQCFDNILII